MGAGGQTTGGSRYRQIRLSTANHDRKQEMNFKGKGVERDLIL